MSEPKYWHDLAKDAQDRAEQLNDFGARRTLHEIASTYLRMARQAEEQLRDAKSSK
jgi:hypothetical protein